MLKSNTGHSWTRNQDGSFCRWNEAPHYSGGVLNLLLAGETRVDRDELSKRQSEYMKLAKRELKR